MAVKRLGYLPELDAVRGVAILLVMFSHVAVPGFRSGGVAGVTLFFVLSGFLITSLLMEELGDHGRVNLGAFYRRRALRLLPALFMLIVVVGVYEIATRSAAGLPAAVLLVLLYIGNWARAAGTSLGLLSHTWSLAIEEQFYLLWPALLLLIRPVTRGRWRIVFSIAVICSVAAMVERVALWHGQSSINRVYFSTDARADGILAGCALALWVTSGRRLRVGWVVGVAGAAAIAAAMVQTGQTEIYLLAPTLAAIGGVAVIAYLATGERSPVFRWRPVCHIGRVSYGLYLWHVPIVWALLPRLAGRPLAARTAIVFGLAFVIAEASYWLIERRFLARKTRLGRPDLEERRGGDIDKVASREPVFGGRMGRFVGVADR